MHARAISQRPTRPNDDRQRRSSRRTDTHQRATHTHHHAQTSFQLFTMGAFSNIGQRFQLRSAASFFDTASFKAPRDLGDVSSRLSANIDFFQANYSIVVAVMLLYVCYYDPNVFYALIVFGGIGFWLFNVRTQRLALSGRQFSEQEILIGFAIGAATILSYIGGSFLTYSLAFGGFLILVHAGLKQPSLGAKLTNGVNTAFEKVQ